MSFSIFRKANVFDIFAQMIDDYEDQTILDFGGNRGNLIASSNGKIKPENYTSLDVSKDSLKLCYEENPGVTTIHWDTYHKNYNPFGYADEPFPNLKTYDIAFANSVFTHMEIDEVLYCVEHLRKSCKVVAFTYIDPNNEEFLLRFQDKYYELELEGDEVCYTTDMKGIFWSAFDTEYLKAQIPGNIKVGKTTWFNYMLIA